MNHIELRYSYLSQKTEIVMNGEKVGPLSSLSALLSRPFSESAMYIIESLDKEVFDDYEIDLFSTVFQYEILLRMSSQSEYCMKIRFHEIESILTADELLNALSGIGASYSISIARKKSLHVYASNDIQLPQSGIFVRSDLVDANIVIYDDVPTGSLPASANVVIILSDEVGLRKTDNIVYYSIPGTMLDSFWDYYAFEFIYVPMISEYLSALSYVNLSRDQAMKISAIKNNQPIYFIGEVPVSMDQGESCNLEFVSFPEGFYSLACNTADIAILQGNYLTACHPGVATLRVMDRDGREIFLKSIQVIKHQYVEEIRILPSFDYLKRNERRHIDIIALPANAEDINHLTWSSSNPNIVKVDETGYVVALENGKSTLCVSGRNTSASVLIEVKPDLQGMYLSQQIVQLKNGRTVILDCNLMPADAPSENLVWELDNRNIASINPSKDKKRCQVIASRQYTGKGNVRCYDANTELGAICNVEVVSKIRHTVWGKLALICWLLGIILPFLLPVSMGASIYGMMKDEEPDHRKRYIVCAVGSILTFLIWISAWMS